MQIYYINLDSQPDRRKRIEWQLGQLGLAATRIAAITPQDIAPDLLARYCPGHGPHTLSPPELACTLSHLEALRQIAGGEAPFGVVIEDDAILSQSLPDFLAAFEAAHLDFGLIKLDSRPEDIVRILNRPAPVISGTRLAEVISVRVATTGYIAAKAAATQIVGSQGVLAQPIDLSLYHPVSRIVRGIRIRDAEPALCAQPQHFGQELESTIEASRLDTRNAATGVAGAMFRIRLRLQQEHLNLQKTVREIAAGGATKRVIPLAPDLLWPIPADVLSPADAGQDASD
jgi:glycosyl transferase family 25